ncbi:MAG: hypothetical protein RLY50_111 [Actinomycetota bacterium]
MREPETLLGTVLAGRYQLDAVRLRATGSVIFDATDITANESVSVRMMLLDALIDTALGTTTQADALDAFERQMETATSLRHPCIESVLDHGEITHKSERHVFAVTERLAGGSLQDFLDRSRRLTPSQALIVGIDVCRALDGAAKQGIIHGDLRPSRLVFGLDRRVRVVGFGSPLRSLDSLGLDQARYSAPELGEGGTRTVSSDVYSLALVLVEAMTGDLPLDGDSVSTVFANRVGKLFPVSADFGALAQVLERAGRATPSDRHSPRELGQALVEAAPKMPRPTPIDIVGTGLFDDDVSATDPSNPIARPLPADIEPVPNQAPSGPILIRTTPVIPGADPSGPIQMPGVSTPSMSAATGSPLVIGSDESGPIVVDPETLRELAAEDVTGVVERPRPRWRRRMLISLAVVVVLAGAGTAAWFTVLNPKNPVPALAGLTEAEARNQVSEFGWDVIVVKERSDEVVTGQVIRTDPVMGANVAKRDSITMIVSEGPTLSVLEEFAGQTATDAAARVTALGLQAAPADVPDENVPVGTVISWSIPEQPTLKAGDSVVKGTTVALNVSTGPALRDIPDLAGLTVEEATAKLTEMGLVTVVEAEKKPHPEIAADKVSVQVPAPGEKLDRGGTVTLTVSAGQQSTLIPDIYGKTFAVVKERLERYGMVIGTVTGDRNRGLKEAKIDGAVVRNRTRVVVGKTVDLTFP